MREGRISQTQSRTDFQIPEYPRPREESDVQCTTNCPRSEESFRSSNLKSSSPIGIRALSFVGDQQIQSQNSDLSTFQQNSDTNFVQKVSPLPSRSRSASRSPHRQILNPSTSYNHDQIPTTSISTRAHGKRGQRDSVKQPFQSTIPHPSSAHYSPEVCDANIASIIYPSPSNEKRRITPRRREIPRMKFPYFWKRETVKPECHLEKKRFAFWSSAARERERLRKEKAWKKVQKGKNGKSSLERQFEWEKGLRRYKSSTWQRNVGRNTRKRYQDKLIHAAVRDKPISNVQELRTDAIMMENELFGTSRDVDEYKTKTCQLVNLFNSRQQLQRRQEVVQIDEPPRNDWQESLSKAWDKLKEFLPIKKSLFTQFWGGQGSPTTSEDSSIPATPCNCREKETKSYSRKQACGIRSGDGDSSMQNETNLSRPYKWKYKPNLKKISPSFRDKNSAVGWNHKFPRDDPREHMNNYDQKRRRGLLDKKMHGNPTQAPHRDEKELDDGEWSIIDVEDSPKLANFFKCFG